MTKSFSHSAITLQRIVDLSNLLSEKKQSLHSKRFSSANVLQPVHMLIMGSITSLISYQHSYISDDAEQSNVEISDRFGITIEELPTVRLFVGGKLVAKLQKITNCEVLRHFVIKNTGKSQIQIPKRYMQTGRVDIIITKQADTVNLQQFSQDS